MVIWGEGEGRWRQGSSDKQTHQPQVRLCPLPSARSCAVGRAGQAREARPAAQRGRRGAAGVGAPRLGLASAALSRAGSKFLSREAAEWILLRIYLYIYSLARSPPLPALPPRAFPRQSSQLPATRAVTPPPPEHSGRGEGASRVSGPEGGGDRG